MRLESVAKTDTGPKDGPNEDAVARLPENGEDFQESNFFLVADGMGGVNAGDVASALVVRSFEDFFSIEDSITDHSEVLKRAFNLANNCVLEHATDHPETQGMGSTGVAIHFDTQYAYIAHVGDSRCYRLRQGRLESLTTDHSYVQALYERGEIPAEERLTHPRRNIITRAIGREPELEVDTSKHAYQEDDIFLLCSDGLCGHVADERIAEVMLQTLQDDSSALEKTASALIDLANGEGGKDNVSVVLIRISGISGSSDMADSESARGEGDRAEVPTEEADGRAPGERPFPPGKFGVLLLTIAIAGFVSWFFIRESSLDGESEKDGYVVRIAVGQEREDVERALRELEKAGWDRSQVFLRQSGAWNLFIWDVGDREAAQGLEEELLKSGIFSQVHVENLPYAVQVGEGRPAKEWQAGDHLEIRKRIFEETGYYTYWQRRKGEYRLLVEAFASPEEAETVAQALTAAGVTCKVVSR